MPSWSQSLLGKSILALLAACLIALSPTTVIGWQMMESVRAYFGEAYARNFTELTAENIRDPISHDLALTRRLADSIVMEEWLRDPDHPDKRSRFFHEIDSYRQAFLDRNYFVASALPPHPIYVHEEGAEYSEEANYFLDRDTPDDSWFFETIDGGDAFNINVDPNPELEVTRVWINVVIAPEGDRLGIVGTGFELNRFVEEFIQTDEAGVTPIVIDGNGAIQAHPNTERIAYNTAGNTDDIEDDQRIQGMLSEAGQQALTRARETARNNDTEIPIFETTLDDADQLIAVDYVDELDWYVLGAVDVETAEVIEGSWLQVGTASVGVAFAVLVLAFGYGVNRLVIRPVGRLHDSATEIAEGNFEVSLPETRNDEIGDLSRAFGIMTEKVRDQTMELEERVQQRTRELETANREMATAQRKVNDSIDYAALIQRALLPDAQLARNLGPNHFVLWHPRDGVGGDFYLFRLAGDRYLIGVVDCAGHGVPGALMTMLARAAFDDAMNRLGIDSPAAILEHADATLREMVQQSEIPRTVATNLDAGLATVDPKAHTIRFAGAKIALHWSDGQRVAEIRGSRRALCDRRKGEYEDQQIATDAQTTWYMVTDGYLDQAGGDLGLSLGNSQFCELLRHHAELPMEDQAEGLERALVEYRGEYAQRDDITVLAFRIP